MCVVGVRAYLTLCDHGHKLVHMCVHLSALHHVHRKSDSLWWERTFVLVFQVTSKEVKGLKCVSYVLLVMYISKNFSFVLFEQKINLIILESSFHSLYVYELCILDKCIFPNNLLLFIYFNSAGLEDLSDVIC